MFLRPTPTLLYIVFQFLWLPFCLAQDSLEIWEIQGTGNSSIYRNTSVQTTANIITWTNETYFYLQSPDNQLDNNPLTSNGIRVDLDATHSFRTGDLVTVRGVVREWDNNTVIQSSPGQVVKRAEAQVLPSAVELNDDFPVGLAREVPELEAVEGMLVRMEDASVNGPTINGRTPMTAKSIRSFREAGIQYPGQSNLPEWDGNPEVFYLNQAYAEAPGPALLSGGMTVSATGFILSQEERYEFRPFEIIVEGDPKSRAIRDRSEKEVTIASFNALFLVSTSSNYDQRIEKLARYVVEILKTPDILAVQEVGGLNVLERLSEEIKKLVPDLTYKAFLNLGTGRIHTGFLVRNTLQDVRVRPLGSNQFLSIGGRLHDRPPMLLEGAFNTDPPTPIQVLNLHLRSLRGIEGDDQDFVRTKRFEQAVSVARMVRSLDNENLVVVGDFNAFQFTDGYVDVMSIITGQPSLGAQRSTDAIVDPPLINHTADIAPEERYSFVFSGNAQILDHILSNELEDIQITGIEYARGNADNSEVFQNNPNTLFRVSDHDAPILFLELSEKPDTMSLQPTSPTAFSLRFPNPFQSSDRILARLVEEGPLQLTLYALDGKKVYDLKTGNLSEENFETNLPPYLPTAFYLLRIRQGQTDKTYKLFYTN